MADAELMHNAYSPVGTIGPLEESGIAFSKNGFTDCQNLHGLRRFACFLCFVAQERWCAISSDRLREGRGIPPAVYYVI